MVDSTTLSHIQSILSKLEKENNITILYAVESGSRAWGFHSPDSDYDIRFIYKHNDPRWYLQINKKPTETINGFSEDRKYDWDGWDLRKAIQHLKESNPAILEWLSSPIVYKDIDGLADELRTIISHMHTKLSLCHHYRNMAVTNWNDRIEGKEIVNTKKYMYIIRPIGMLDWLMRYPEKTLVIDYYQILKELEKDTDPVIIKKIYELLEFKKEAKEMGENPRIAEIDKWIQEIITKFDKTTDRKPAEVNVQNITRVYSHIDNQYRKVIKLGSKDGHINRSEYLIIIGHTLQFVWLQQHPDKNKTHIPERIADLLKDVKLPDNIRAIMVEITSKDELENLRQLTSAKSENTLEIQKVNDDDRRIHPNKWLEYFQDILIKYSQMTKVPFDADTCLYGLDKLPREDLIEFWMKKQIPELLWLLENPSHSMGKIPKQVHTKVKAFTPKLRESIGSLIDENKTKYYMLYPELNEWINQLLIDNKDEMEKVKQRNQEIKEELVHKNYQYSIKKLDPEVFNEVFVNHVYVRNIVMSL